MFINVITIIRNHTGNQKEELLHTKSVCMTGRMQNGTQFNKAAENF